MTTSEPVIASALLQNKEYDIFRCVKKATGFLSARDIQEPFRFTLRSLEWETAPDVQDLVCEVQLWSLGQPIGVAHRTTHSTERGVWDEVLFFPIHVSQLPLDAIITISVQHPVVGLVGATAVYPFTSRGELKTGVRRYKVVPDADADAEGPDALADAVSMLDPVHASSSPAAKEEASWGKLERDFRRGRMVRVPWLDKLADRTLDTLRSPIQQGFDDGKFLVSSLGCDFDSLRKQGATVVLEFTATSNSLPVFHMSVPRDYDSLAQAYAAAPSPFVPHYDLDIHMENLSESKAATLSKSMHMVGDKNAQPSFNQRKQIKAILSRPPVRMEPMKVDDAALLWQFRYFLSREVEGFVPFMSCVDWTSAAEREEAEKLICEWNAQLPTEDALVLLSADFRSVHSLRKHAVKVLNVLTDEMCLSFLLQLVQGVRYDVKNELSDFLCRRAVHCWPLCSNLYWYVCVEEELETVTLKKTQKGAASSSSSSAQGQYSLLKKAFCERLKEENAEFLLRLERQQELRCVLQNVHTTLTKDSSKDRKKKIELLGQILDHKDCGFKDLFNPVGPSLHEMGDEPVGEEEAAAATASSESKPRTGLYLPSHPENRVKDVKPQGVYIFKSAKQPLKIPFVEDMDEPHHCFTADDDDDPLLGDVTTSSMGQLQMEPSVFVPSLSTEISPSSRTIDLMWKSGDDVRQDQLVIQMIQLVDKLLKQNGLNLCLTPYSVLATSTNDGFLEIVQNCKTLQDVQKETVVKFLQKHNGTGPGLEEAMDKFVRSCAGYCVITFLLGIGDRHLENLMVVTDGRLFHIDFGFIMGHDPKPFPPPMKLNKEMVDAMGGPNSRQYQRFKTFCCSAYSILRKHARLILSLLQLMMGASIQQLSGDGRLNLLKVQDKLRLDLNDAEATQYIQGVINTATGAFFTNVWDFIHEAVQDLRQ